MSTLFKNRSQAAVQLAQRLISYAARPDVVVLGLPRGGIPLACVIARTLQASLDVLLVRKLGLPSQPEYAIGAVTSDGARLLHTRAIRMLGVSEASIEAVTAEAHLVLLQRAALYRNGRPPLPLHGQIVIVVDDGVATGATMTAALRLVRQQGPARLIAAVPVASAQALHRLKEEADAVVCLHAPLNFDAVGQYYEDFQQISDREVVDMLGLK